jgi:hypothetical protein
VKFAEWLKMWVALAGGIATGGLGLADLPAQLKLPLEFVTVIATAVAVWNVKNADPVDPTPPAAVAPIVAARRMVGRKVVEPPQYRLAA